MFGIVSLGLKVKCLTLHERSATHILQPNRIFKYFSSSKQISRAYVEGFSQFSEKSWFLINIWYSFLQSNNVITGHELSQYHLYYNNTKQKTVSVFNLLYWGSIVWKAHFDNVSKLCELISFRFLKKNFTKLVFSCFLILRVCWASEIRWARCAWRRFT